MPRQRKPSKVLNCKLEIETWEQLDRYCNDTGSNKTFVAEKALREFLAKHEKEQAILAKYKNEN